MSVARTTAEAAKQRRDQAMNRLSQLIQERQRKERMLQSQMQMGIANQEFEQGEAQRAQNLNVYDDLLKGSAMGSMLGPWGMLAGAGLGLTKGLVQSIGQSKSEGRGFKGALGKAFKGPGGGKGFTDEMLMDAMKTTGGIHRMLSEDDSRKSRAGGAGLGVRLGAPQSGVGSGSNFANIGRPDDEDQYMPLPTGYGIG